MMHDRPTSFARALETLRSIDPAIRGVWAIDHGVTELRSLDGDGVLALPSDVRDVLLAGRPLAHEGRHWVPVSECDQPIVVLEASTAVAPPPYLGACCRLLRSRFDDIDRARRRRDMSVAAELQWSVLPVRADHTESWSVGAALEPAYEVAGDLFDHAVDRDSVWVTALDGMGHGLEATLLGVVATSALRNARRSNATLSEQFAAANRAVFDWCGGGAFVTAVGCRFDPDGTVEVINAGHAPTRVVRGGRARRLDLVAQPPLGVDPDATYPSISLSATEIGDGVVLASDGLDHALSGGDPGGAGDVIDELVTRCWHEAPLVTVLRLVERALDGGDLSDDVSIVTVRRSTPDARPIG